MSSQGSYDAYTEGQKPLVVMGTPDDHLQVRAYIDEILVHRLADPAKIEAQMFIRGTDTHLPLAFARIQPYVSPKIELADEREERVDVRALPVIFRFERPKGPQPLSWPAGRCLCGRKIIDRTSRCRDVPIGLAKLGAGVLLCILAGCAVGPDFVAAMRHR